jgi:hypothetical protein
MVMEFESRQGPTQPNIEWVLAYFQWVKLLGSEVDHSSTSGAEVKNE